MLTSDWDEFENWLSRSGKDILIIIGVLFATYLVFRAVFPRIARTAIMSGSHPPDAEAERRATTIIDVVDRTAGIVIFVIAVVTILPEIGVDITALVAGLGITGLALALGAQTLVRDGISGVFLLAEDQYRTGDVIRIADVTGTVEAITLRRTIIRDRDGVVHSVPNGAITVVSNYTRDFATVNVPVEVAYGEDLAKVSAIVERIGREMMQDERLASMLTDAPSLGGVDSVAAGAVTVSVTTRTTPGARWDVTAELRRRLAEAFLAENVRVPFASVAKDDKAAG